MNNFKVGDRVKVIGNNFGPKHGSTGTIRAISSKSLGVEFDNWTEGHKLILGEELKSPSGWWCYPKQLKKLSKDWDE